MESYHSMEPSLGNAKSLSVKSQARVTFKPSNSKACLPHGIKLREICTNGLQDWKAALIYVFWEFLTARRNTGGEAGEGYRVSTLAI